MRSTMRRYLFVILVKLLCLQLALANDPLEISILTCAPGEPIYSVFGHSAIRVIDREKGIDHIYDFGTFDFDTPNFSYKFLKGKLKYQLSIRNTERFIQAYSLEGRSVIEQKLNLSMEQKRQVVAQLQYLYRPENRYYYYSFLEKDCSTDLRDLLSHVGVEFSNKSYGATKRDLINSYLAEKYWMRLGVNLIMGTDLDAEASHFQSMFLPNYLMDELTATKFKGENLVRSESQLNEVSPPVNHPLAIFVSPVVVFSLMLLILIIKPSKWLFFTLALAVGLTGLIILALWLFSGHPELKSNFNLLWCNPLYLLYLPMIFRNRVSKWLTWTLLSTVALAALVWLFQWQSFDIGVLPLLLILGLFNLKALRKLKAEPVNSGEVLHPQSA